MVPFDNQNKATALLLTITVDTAIATMSPYITVVNSNIGEGKLGTALDTLKLKSKRKEIAAKAVSQKDKDGYAVLLCGAKKYIEVTGTKQPADEIVHIVAGVISEIRDAAEKGKIESDSKMWYPHEKGGRRPQATEVSEESDKTGQEVVERAVEEIMTKMPIAAAPAHSSSERDVTETDTTEIRRKEIEALMGELDMDVSALPINKKDCLKLGSKQIADLGKLCKERIPDFYESFVMVDGELKHGKRGTPVRMDWTDGIYRFLKS